MVEKIQVLTHSSIRIESRLGVIYADPFEIAEESHDAAYILVTHEHHDHFSPEDIRKIAKEDTILIVPESMKKKAGEAAALVQSIETMTPGTKRRIKDLEIEAVPAYNQRKPFHPKRAGWVGYILTLEGRRIYIAGDTDFVKENETLRCDIALVPIGGTYTMNAEKAAAFINAIAPEIAIPTHYGNIVGKEGDAETFASLVKPPVKVERKILF